MDASKKRPGTTGKAYLVARNGNSGKQKAPPGGQQGFMVCGG